MTADEMARWCAEIEVATGAAATHFDLAEAFKRITGDLAEDDPLRPAAEAARAIFDLFLPEEGEFRDRWGPLAPMMVSDQGCYPPPVDKFPEASAEIYARWEPIAIVPAARARLQDFLWLRNRDHVRARKAIGSYLEAARSAPREDLDGMARDRYLRRAHELSRMLGGVQADVAEQLIETAESLLTAEPPGYLCRLVDFAAEVLASFGERSRKLLESVVALADRYGTLGGEQRHMERSLLDAAAALGKEMGDEVTAKSLRELAARSYEREAEDRASEGGLIRTALLHDALTAYQQLGMRGDLERVKRLLHDATEIAEGELKSVSSSYELTREEIERAVDATIELGKKLGERGYLYVLAINPSLWPDWDDIGRQTAEFKRDFPLQFLFRQMHIGPDGQPIPRPTDPAAEQYHDEATIYLRRLQIALQIISAKVEVLRERVLWSPETLIDTIMESPIFETSRKAIHCGIEAFSAERYWEALHVLMPQIERAIRRLARSMGADVYTFQSSTGRLHWKSLDQILAIPAVHQALNQIRPTLAKQLELLLVDPIGGNLRNDVAHGVLDPEGEPYGHALLTVLILLALSTLRITPRAGGDHTPEPPPAQS